MFRIGMRKQFVFLFINKNITEINLPRLRTKKLIKSYNYNFYVSSQAARERSNCSFVSNAKNQQTKIDFCIKPIYGQCGAFNLGRFI